jgi:anion-transporting  ArsA/GET3 family ATPase
VARIVFVTGKGGSGKTTLARALAAEAGRRRVAVLRVRFPASAEDDVAVDPDEQVLDGHRDLEAFLTRLLGFGFLARRLQSSATFSAVAAAAPGLRDLVALTTVAALAKRRRGLVLVDAPSSGHSAPLVESPARVLEMASVGPIAKEAAHARQMLANPRAFSALVVATPEELSVTEAARLRSDLVAAGVASCRIVLNGCWPDEAAAEDAGRIAAASPDAALYLRRRARQVALEEALLAEAGPCPRVRFAFGSQTPPADDVAALFDLLEESAA